MGVSVENEEQLYRVRELVKVPARVRFLSIEPMLGPLPDLVLAGINWVIVGGETGDKYRTMNSNWVRQIRDRCVEQGVPFYFKQWHNRYQATTRPPLDGKVWEQFQMRNTEISKQAGGKGFHYFR